MIVFELQYCAFVLYLGVRSILKLDYSLLPNFSAYSSLEQPSHQSRNYPQALAQ